MFCIIYYLLYGSYIDFNLNIFIYEYLNYFFLLVNCFG